MNRPYFTIRIRHTFGVLTRGAFNSIREARAWAAANTGGNYSVMMVIP